jgi:L-lactate dehydrogenase complex protein LldG
LVAVTSPSSREQILSSIRRHLPESSPLPAGDGPWIAYDDPVAQFASVLESIGGRCVRVKHLTDVERELLLMPEYANARRVVSTIPGVGDCAIDLSGVRDPHELEDVAFAVLRGHFGVAENAAVWVTDDDLPHRVIYFLCEHLALVVPADQIVHNLHAAYERIRFEGPRFGTFIAGPSKTADIEQSLVIGAHGPKSLSVFVVG